MNGYKLTLAALGLGPIMGVALGMSTDTDMNLRAEPTWQHAERQPESSTAPVEIVEVGYQNSDTIWDPESRLPTWKRRAFAAAARADCVPAFNVECDARCPGQERGIAKNCLADDTAPAAAHDPPNDDAVVSRDGFESVSAAPGAHADRTLVASDDGLAGG